MTGLEQFLYFFLENVFISFNGLFQLVDHHRRLGIIIFLLSSWPRPLSTHSRYYIFLLLLDYVNTMLLTSSSVSPSPKPTAAHRPPPSPSRGPAAAPKAARLRSCARGPS